MSWLRIFSIALMCSTINSIAGAQPLIDVKEFYSTAKNNLYQLYRDSVREKSLLFRGVEYIRYGNTAKGHPFLEREGYEEGLLSYAGINYPNAQLNYDVFQNVVIIPDYYNQYSIQLFGDQIDSFRIGARRFIRLAITDSSVLRPGFYEILYNDLNCEVLARNDKRLVAPIRTEDPARFIEEVIFFIKKKGVYTRVQDKRSLRKIFKENWQRIEERLNAEGMLFRQDPRKYLVNVAMFHSIFLKQ